MKRDAVHAAGDSSALEVLMSALRCLPGVGPRSAQRMAFHLLQRDQAGAALLAQSLTQALAVIRHCERCNSFTEAQLCGLCVSARRDQGLLCVVEMPADQLAKVIAGDQGCRAAVVRTVHGAGRAAGDDLTDEPGTGAEPH